MNDIYKEKETDIIRLLYKIFVLLKSEIHNLVVNEGIGPSHGIIIKTISENKKIRITKLSKILGFSNSTLSGILEKLRTLGIIERKRCDKDRRVFYVSISKEFEKKHGIFHHKINDHVEKTVKKASLSERKKIIEGLALLKDLLEKSKNLEKT